jgi:hypothetical protein
VNHDVCVPCKIWLFHLTIVHGHSVKSLRGQLELNHFDFLIILTHICPTCSLWPNKAISVVICDNNLEEGWS